ncbi:MAG: hypothetical protein DI601_07200 [Azospirillum brasilense]|nr:MAG: hypothetical protein DI601_07200 [Azospirillum brasilense]
MRALKVLVIVMGVLIVAGTVGLIAVIVQRMSAATPTAQRIEGGLGQPAGTRIRGLAGAGDRVAVWVEGPQGERVLLLDPRSGRVLGELRPTE